MTTVAAVYCRKSNEQETGSSGASLSVERQEQHAREFIQKMGWTVGPTFTDDGISGAHFTRLAGRAKLLAEAESGAFNIVVVSEQSRLGRDMLESTVFIRNLIESGVRVFCYLDGTEINMEDELGQALTMLKGFGAASERRQTAKRVYDAARKRVSEGKVAGGAAYGYTTRREGNHSVRVINEEQAAVVRHIFKQYASGIGTPRIAQRLNRDGVPPPRPGGWKHSTIRGILLNELYIGQLVWGRLKSIVRKGKHTVVPRPESEWQRLPAEHLRIVDQLLWEQVQALHSRRSASLPRTKQGKLLGRATWRDGHSEHLLSGFLACGVCGGSVRITNRVHGTARSGKRTLRFYICSQFENGGRAVCVNLTKVQEDEFNHAVVDRIAAMLSERMLADAVDRALERIENLGDDIAKDRARLERELSAISTREQRLISAITEGQAPDALVAALKGEQSRRAEIQQQLATLNAPVKAFDAVKVKRELLTLAQDVRGLLTGDNLQMGRQMLRKLLVGPLAVTPESGGVRFSGKLTLQRLLTGLAVGTGRPTCTSSRARSRRPPRPSRRAGP